MPVIRSVHAREILDSRGNPTVEVDVLLDSGAFGRASAPSGASTGRAEALELRDGDPARFRGKGVLKAVANVNALIAPALSGFDAAGQPALDRHLIALDGTPGKSRLGANAVLGVSLAFARAAAAEAKMPLYAFLGGDSAVLLPLPMINILSGGHHAGHTLEFQDFLIIPVGASSCSEAIRWATDVHHAMRRLLAERGFPIGLADEGGFGPRLPSNEEALKLLAGAVERAGYAPGQEIAFALDVASSHFYEDGSYVLRSTGSGKRLSAREMAGLLSGMLDRYPILSIEDGMAEEDWEGWKLLTGRLGKRVQLLGDDLFATNPQRLRRGIESGAANAVLVKVNQIGTLTEALEVVKMAQAAGYNPVVSARSGETEDSFIADLSVATHAGQIKIGSVASSERLSKYNQLIRIEEELGSRARFAGIGMANRSLLKHAGPMP